ncbi:MAG: hypothetical protein KJ718_02565 [Nanoarchaeota archaeon]|nr:hypothetical protein [Nanoarchaeota archaeon]MBU1051413.1 hypothetical protein [Nanoarchaeota archaeon]MBU1988284.1 hypothetical protein [Nanoarchaeota archaeon]
MALESFGTWYTSLPVWLVLIITVWSLVWKGLALWKAAAKNKSPIWFIVLLVVNTISLLEILYIFIFSEMRGKSKTAEPKVKKRK